MVQSSAFPLAMLWQSVHRIAPPTVVDRCSAWRPENGLLFSGVPAVEPILWHCRHPASVFPSMDPSANWAQSRLRGSSRWRK